MIPRLAAPATQPPALRGEALERGDEGRPLARITVPAERVQGRDLEHVVYRTPEPLPQDPLRKGHCLPPLRLGNPVHLVEHEDQILDARANLADQGQLLARDRRVGADHQDRSVNLWDEPSGGGGVGLEDGAEPRGVHEATAGAEQRSVHGHFRGGDPFALPGLCSSVT